MRDVFSFLPRGFASLADYISPAAFDVVDWKGALRRSARITREIMFGTKVDQVKKDLIPILPEGIVFWDSADFGPRPTISHSVGRDLGFALLELYFAQLRRPGAVFLDLRMERFTKEHDDLLIWSPNGLWTEFSPAFSWALIDLYKGFYEDNSDLLKDAVRRLGLWPPELSEAGQEELIGLLDNHFGQGRREPMCFEVSHFVRSFDALFVFLRSHKIRVSEEFLFLGICILTLYLHLEKRGGRYDVALAFEQSKKNVPPREDSSQN